MTKTDEPEQCVDPEQVFQNFFKDEKYRQKINQFPIFGKKTLTVDFQDIYAFNQDLGRMLLEKPEQYLRYAANAAYEQLRIEDPAYAETIEKEQVQISICQLLKSEPLRDLSADQLGKLVMVEGIVVRATPTQPLIREAAFKCKACGTTTMVPQTTAFVKAPEQCMAPDCGKKGQYMLTLSQEGCSFVDSQDLHVQERPEDLPPGQLPRTLNVKLIGKEIVETARPGDHISIVGIPKTTSSFNPGVGKPCRLNLMLEANSIEVLGKDLENTVTPQEQQKIEELSKDSWIHRKIVNSIAPSIYGYEYIKEAIMYLLFGGVTKHLVDITVRGEANVLIIGDPGTAKSQMLQYMPRITPRGIYTSGKGSSGVGLTAAVVKDKDGGLSLQAGAMVLADRGIIMIDEFEKMKPEDRVAIHEAMEQHSVSVAKGGIVATLNARTSVLAAANPAMGRYDPYKTVLENVLLPVTLLSRFDLIFIIKDTPDKAVDDLKAEHILQIHRTHASPIEPAISRELLKKYIAYAKTIDPILSLEAMQHLKEFYLKMRGVTDSGESPVAITARQLESLVRIAEARARVALRKEVTVEDAEAAIKIMQKSLEDVGIDSSSYKIDIDLIMTGKPKSARDKMSTILTVIGNLNRSSGPVKREEIIEQLEIQKIAISKQEAERFISQMLREGQLFEPREGLILKT
jgi:replicative DNA helicase Mcm